MCKNHWIFYTPLAIHRVIEPTWNGPWNEIFSEKTSSPNNTNVADKCVIGREKYRNLFFNPLNVLSQIVLQYFICLFLPFILIIFVE